MKKQYGIVYMCINIINGKKYIGQTIQPIENRISQHKSNSKANVSALYNAIRKYGWNSFEWKIVDYATDEDDLNEKEIMYIEKFDTYSGNNNGYNMTLGGGGTVGFGKLDIETVIKIKEMLILTSFSTSRIGQELGVHGDVVQSIYYGQAWSHVDVQDFEPRMIRSKVDRVWECIKLTDADVIKIKEMLRDGFQGNEIAKALDVSEVLVSAINRERIWKHIFVEGFIPSEGRKYGHEHINASLTEEEVFKIKEMVMEDEYNLTEIARMYNVDKTTISRIAKGNTYKNVNVEGFEPKERTSKGSKNGMAKLNEKQVIEIKKMIRDEGMNNTEIAKIYGVLPNTISRIRTGKRWGHI